jgi:two-component system chemotaxis response regulator CheB
VSTIEQEAVRPDIFVVGASAGGVEALEQLVHQLPADFPGALFVVLHIARGESVLPQILAKRAQLPVIVARDGEPIERGAVYVAVPDHHLVLEANTMRVVKGPMQHRNRPAIDVLFRTAAAHHGPRVVGVVLTGMLDDGSAGLLDIKRTGGIAVVQDPSDARFPEMPRNALRSVPVDHCLPLVAIARLLVDLSRGRAPHAASASRRPQLQKNQTMPDDATPSVYSCPDCHGVLWEIADPDLLRFRCRVGHGYSAESLGLEHDRAVEDALWAAVRSVEEQASLARRMADQWRARDAVSLARELDCKADRGEGHALRLRELLMADEAQPDRTDSPG